ncbi:hypothetical protein, partial [Singulisphaera acidiphila]
QGGDFGTELGVDLGGFEKVQELLPDCWVASRAYPSWHGWPPSSIGDIINLFGGSIRRGWSSGSGESKAMRAPERIDQVLAVVREVWYRYPDLRLGQLIVNAVQPDEPCSQVYAVEDTVLVRKLESLAKRWGRIDA